MEEGEGVGLFAECAALVGWWGWSEVGADRSSSADGE
jgi:hypothetical protein